MRIWLSMDFGQCLNDIKSFAYQFDAMGRRGTQNRINRQCPRAALAALLQRPRGGGQA